MSQTFIPFALPDITRAEIEEVSAVLQSGWITTGQKAKEFENRFAVKVRGQFGVAVNSCTAALHLALEAIGVGVDDEVIVPTITFAASAEVVRYLGARPILVDVDAGDHNIDPGNIEKVITARTKAIIPVHFGGQSCKMDSILEIARARNLKVIEDAAHAFPCSYRGRPVGSIGDITCFSFYATKTITTGEGGMAVTDNVDWADRMRVMSLHGISRDAWKRYTAEGSWYYEILAPGFKYNMTDISAAMGLAQLLRAEEMLAKRRAIAGIYDEAFRSLDALELLDVQAESEHARHLYVIKLRDGVLKIDRNQFIEELKQLGVGTSVHFIPLHMHPYYRDTFGYHPKDLPVAYDVYGRCISLPIYSSMDKNHVVRVIESVLHIAAMSRR